MRERREERRVVMFAGTLLAFTYGQKIIWLQNHGHFFDSGPPLFSCIVASISTNGMQSLVLCRCSAACLGRRHFNHRSTLPLPAGEELDMKGTWQVTRRFFFFHGLKKLTLASRTQAFLCPVTVGRCFAGGAKLFF